jgi:hypothetical protein
MNGYSYMQWKVAMAQMQDANLAATEITEQGKPTRPEARKIAERQLDYYFQLVEADLNYRRKLHAERSQPMTTEYPPICIISPSEFDPGTAQRSGSIRPARNSARTNIAHPSKHRDLSISVPPFTSTSCAPGRS